MTKCYIHVDLDAFFASVEQLLHPEYRNKPVIVGGIPGDRRSVVSTASYEARKFGVHSAMPLSKAVELCPDGIFVRGNYSLYADFSYRIMEIFHDFSPFVIQMSIDEAFIDITGTEKLFGTPVECAKLIKKTVFEKTGLTVSTGISCSMYVAKIASGYKKPDGLTYVAPGDEERFMLSLPLDKLWGAGTKTQERLKSAGITSMKALYEKSASLLRAVFGDNLGLYLYNAVRGNMDMKFGEEAKSRSISAERTFEYDLKDIYAVDTALMELSHIILWRMHKEKVRSRTVTLKIRFDDFKTITLQETSDIPVSNSDDFFERIRRLLLKKYDGSCGIRLLGAGVSGIENEDSPFQGQLFQDMNSKKARLEKAVFDMESKNPELKVKKARLM